MIFPNYLVRQIIFSMHFFTEKELFAAISYMGLNKAPGSDGFHVEFYQKFATLLRMI